MEQLKKKVRIVPMTNEYLNDVAELERTCFSNPWSRNMLAEELENACSAFLVALDAENGSVVGYAGLLAVADEGFVLRCRILFVISFVQSSFPAPPSARSFVQSCSAAACRCARLESLRST